MFAMDSQFFKHKRKQLIAKLNRELDPSKGQLYPQLKFPYRRERISDEGKRVWGTQQDMYTWVGDMEFPYLLPALITREDPDRDYMEDHKIPDPSDYWKECRKIWHEYKDVILQPWQGDGYMLAIGKWSAWFNWEGGIEAEARVGHLIRSLRLKKLQQDQRLPLFYPNSRWINNVIQNTIEAFRFADDDDIVKTAEECFALLGEYLHEKEALEPMDADYEIVDGGLHSYILECMDKHKRDASDVLIIDD